MTRRLYGLARINYSLKDSQLVEGLMGLEYNGGCWVLRSVIQRLATAENSRNSAFFIQLELNGLGRLGSNPIDVLKQSIPGYANTSDIISSRGLSLHWVLVLLPSPLRPNVEVVDQIAAVVNDEVITRSELESRYKEVLSQLRQQNTPLPPRTCWKSNCWNA